MFGTAGLGIAIGATALIALAAGGHGWSTSVLSATSILTAPVAVLACFFPNDRARRSIALAAIVANSVVDILVLVLTAREGFNQVSATWNHMPFRLALWLAAWVALQAIPLAALRRPGLKPQVPEDMVEPPEADRVWNRAALEGGGKEPREGDKALAALLLAHGLVMNGGVEHAIDALDAHELEAAATGFRFFSFENVASFLEESSRGVVDEEIADETYAQMIACDAVLVNRFEECLKASPESFAPL